MSILYFYFLFGAFIIFVEIFRKKRRFYDFLTFANGYYFLCYSITPIYFYNINDFYSHDSEVKLFSLGYVIIGYVFLLLGYFWQNPRNFAQVNFSKNLHFVSSKIISYFKYIFLVICILTFIYFTGYGGIFSALSKGAMIRYGYADSVVSDFSVLHNVVSMLPILSGFFFYLFLVKPSTISKWQILIYLIFSLIINFLNILVGSSRGAFVHMFMLYFLMYAYVSKKINLKLIILLGASAGLFIIYGKQLFFATATFFSGGNFIEAFVYLKETRSTDETPRLMLILSEFRHGIASLERSILEVERIGYTYFSDYFWSLLRIIPQKITLQIFERPETISALNTYSFTGVSISSMPPGILASNYYAFGPLGVAIGMLFYGVFGKLTELYYSKKMRFRMIYIIPYVFLASSYGGFISNGDPNVYIYGIIWPIMATLLINKVENVF